VLLIVLLALAVAVATWSVAGLSGPAPRRAAGGRKSSGG
jgi:hypothetical protein